jgi:predicted nucleic acid-binding protein
VSLVLDASAALAWVYQAETTEASQEILDRVAAEGAWVPAIWRLEIANGLYTGMRRKRIDGSYRDQALATLALYDIKEDAETWQHAWGATLRLADQFGLPPYDAAYVELAQRRAMPIAALDRAIRDAAIALGVPLIGAR